eukprot:g5475.t1
MIFLFLALPLVPFLGDANGFVFVPSTKARLPHQGRHSSGGSGDADGRLPQHTLKGAAEEGRAVYPTENAAAADTSPPSAVGSQGTYDLGPGHLDGVAANMADGISTTVSVQSVPTRAPRVYLGGSKLHVGKIVELTTEQNRYLVSVMRLRDGSPVRVFDGVNGEFLASVSSSSGRGGMRSAELRVDTLIRRQPNGSSGNGSWGQDVAAPGVELLFAPIRKQRLKHMVEKTVELGVSRLTPVLTARTQKSSVLDPKALGKLGLVTAVEAAEQCERMTVPRVEETPVPLLSLLRDVELRCSCTKRGSCTDAQAGRDIETIFVCKERDTDAKPILEALADYARDRQDAPQGSGDGGRTGGNSPRNAEAAFLVGPEGGFDPDEMRAMAAYPFVRFVSLGPLVLRAETAAMYALSSWSAFWTAQ